MFAEPIIHSFYTNRLCVMCLWSSWLERSPLKWVDFISRVRIPLVLLHLSLFKPLFSRCIPPLRVSCLDRVVVRAVDSNCQELSIASQYEYIFSWSKYQHHHNGIFHLYQTLTFDLSVRGAWLLSEWKITRNFLLDTNSSIDT